MTGRIKKIADYLVLLLREDEFWLVVICGLIFRAIGDFHDGLSDRGAFPGGQVGFWAWHGINWLRRDLVQASLIVWEIMHRFRARHANVTFQDATTIMLIVMFAVALMSQIVHEMLYDLAYTYRYLFAF